jgi:hypothetical protein
MPPAVGIVGLWHGKTPAGDEYVTFTADGRAILQQGAAESMTMKYKLDLSSPPLLKLDLAGTVKDTKVTLYTVFDFPSPGKFRMAPPAVEEGKRPDSKTLEGTKTVLERVTLGGHAGIYQVVDASLKKLAGTWDGKDGGQTMTLTFSTDGTYAMKVAEISDKGRFRIDVTKVPLGIDLLSSEGAGVKYSIFELNAEGLRVGKAGKNPDERPQAFDDISARTFKKKGKGGTSK